MVATAGPPGAGKSSILPIAVPDLSSRLVIDPDRVKDYLARWCTEHAAFYADLLSTALPDGGTVRPLELSPLLQTVSTEVANAVRRDALAQRMDIVVEATMASPAYGERLLLSLAKADYEALLIVSVETDQRTAHARAVERWWTGRQAEPELGGRLVLPETIDAAYPGARSASACRTNVRDLAETIRSGGTSIEHVTIVEYDDGALARLDADPPRALDA
ncbi:zeta toxin family protein [Isoptericola aurantiacus]|uniref:zeta toxin family protein n=1 Tax=Isoptericola aurantiacus TaxID=3377839 RepID=UPI00383A5FB1